MEWYAFITLIFVTFIILMATGMPVSFAFILTNLIWVPFVWPWDAGMQQVITGMSSSLVNFALVPLVLFILMGDVMFHSGIAPHLIDALDNWLGRLPGRLGLVAVGAGVLIATLTGASMAATTMLGASLVPEMEKRGYKKPMSLGPILGSGGLAIMIPPSGLAILIGFIGQMSIGRMLIGIIIPGLLMALFYGTYTIVRCKLQPELAPPYDVPPIPITRKLVDTAEYILPIAFIIFMVLGVMFVGIATPSEAAATGALGTFILAACYRRLNWTMTKKALVSSLRTSVMILLLISVSSVFGQILSFSGAAAGLAEFAANLPVAPILVIIAMQIVLLILGCFMSVAPIIMITLPILMPIVRALNFDPVWFGVIYLLNMEMATTTPPFGLSLFAMKAVAPPDTTMKDIYLAGLPYLGCDLCVMILMLAFPPIALWLPSMMLRPS